jgi:FkbM family methyltransferase
MCSRVIAFEPNEVSAAMFRKNVEYNQLKGNGEFLNIELVVRPIGQYDGIMTEKLWLAGKDDKFGETIGEFDFVTIDRFLRCRADVNWVSLIFIDADGWDYDVIMGAEFVVNKCHPYIIMEANYALQWRGHTIENVYNWADTHNYDCVFLDAQCPGNILLIPDFDKIHNGDNGIYVSE